MINRKMLEKHNGKNVRIGIKHTRDEGRLFYFTGEMIVEEKGIMLKIEDEIIRIEYENILHFKLAE